MLRDQDSEPRAASTISPTTSGQPAATGSVACVVAAAAKRWTFPLESHPIHPR